MKKAAEHVGRRMLWIATGMLLGAGLVWVQEFRRNPRRIDATDFMEPKARQKFRSAAQFEWMRSCSVRRCGDYEVLFPDQSSQAAILIRPLTGFFPFVTFVDETSNGIPEQVGVFARGGYGIVSQVSSDGTLTSVVYTREWPTNAFLVGDFDADGVFEKMGVRKGPM